MQQMWQLRYYHGFTMDEQLGWLPYERDIFIDMTMQEVEERSKQKEKNQ